MKSLIIIIALILAAYNTSQAQSAYLFNQNKGLPNSLINDISIDDNGHIWIATMDGLCIYDGRAFHRCDIQYRNINRIYKLPNRDYLIATNQGILKYTYETNRFSEIKFETKKQFFQPYITDIAGNDSTIYITSSGYGLYSLSKGDSLFRPSSLNNMVDDQYLKSIFIDSQHRIWIGSYQEQSYLINRSQVQNPEMPKEISQYMQDETGNIYALSTNNGITITDPKCKTYRRVSLQGVGEDFPASAIKIVNSNKILIGTDGLGLWEYNPETGHSNQVLLSDVPFDFSKSKIHDITIDKFGNTWLGVYNKGLLLITKESPIFQNYGYKPDSPQNLGSNSISAMTAVGSDIWAGTDGDGIYIISDNKPTQHINVYDSHSKKVPANIVSMYNQDNKYIWIGTYNNDFLKMDISKKQVVKSYDLPCQKVSSIADGGNGKLLISSFGMGIGVFDTKSETFERGIMVNPLWSNCIKKDHQQNYWISTYSGMWYVDSDLKGSRHYSADDGYLPDNSVNSIYINKQNHVWCGTNSGIMVLNPITEEHRHILKKHSICSIVEDAMGMVWISTRDGLFRYNPDNSEILEFGMEDGLLGTEFTRGAGLLMPNGMACFGGVMGVTKIKTDILTDSVKPGNVIPRQLIINNQYIQIGDTLDGEVIINKNITDIDTIYLHESQNTFSIEFSTTNPAHLDQTTFEYRMLNLDHDSTFFQSPKGLMHTSYTNLDPGTYTLQVRAIIGHSTTPTRSITIVIHPYWYHTTAFKTAVIILILLILTLLYEFINEKVSRKQSDQINEMKMQFFINISHEIRTPLTLIIDPLEKLLAKGAPDMETARLYSIMKTNSQRILRLVSQLLDLRKIDKGQVMMKFGKTDLYPFIKEIMDSCGPMMDSKEISVDITSSQPEIYAWVDPENFEKIILNLLHNATKFTPVGGQIDVELFQDNENGVIQITVQDNGIGLNTDDIGKIFNRFYQVKSQQNRYTTGTGVGLHLARYLTELHGGKLYASNRTDRKGSRFTIELPMGNKHLNPNDILEEEITTASINKETRTLAMEYKQNMMEEQKLNSKKTIYIADDEESIRQYLQEELEDIYNVALFENGKKAMENIIIQKPDLIISDIMMPEMDGWTLCRKVKRNYKTSHIPVILLTALGDDVHKGQGIDIGADMYLEKPFNTEILKKIIRNMLINRDKVIANIAGKAEDFNIENIEIKSQDDILMQKVMQIIKDNISCRDLNVEMLSDTIGISRVHLHRKIKEITGMSARDYLKHIRMKQASYLLTDKTLSISEVAYAVGYSNPGHFSSSFKAFYGVSPSEYAHRQKEDFEDEEFDEDSDAD